MWPPVAAVFGAAWRLNLPIAPPPWLAGVGLAACCALGVLIAWIPSARASGAVEGARRVLAGLFVLAAGFWFGALAAQLRAVSVAQPAYVAVDDAVQVEGWVADVDMGERGPRLMLLTRAISGVDAPPRYVRVAVSGVGVLTPGRGARCRAELAPPSSPLAPGAYDFARRAYFEQLGAVGFAYGRCTPADLPPPPGLLDRLALQVAAMRADVSAAMRSAAPGRGGDIAAAIATGDRGAVDRVTNDTLFNAGLGHLLSVSGVHMAVVGGLVFAALRWLFALIPAIALRFPVKKIAAAGALVALGAYLVLSGSSVPAVRAYVMAAVAFGAILIDRPAISMRGLALAALIIVALFPESVLEPGFQMSFAATLALVALFELMAKPPDAPALPTPGPMIGAMQAMVRNVGGVIAVSVVAGLATDPFALYHFQRFALFSLPANLVVAPIMTFIVAPAAGAAAVLAPFGWADVPLQIMASGLDLVAAVGDAFGARADAIRMAPKPPDAAMLLCVAAMLWGALWRGALRWFALAPFVGALALYAFAPQPAVAFDADLRAVYARVSEGGDAHWALMGAGGRSTFARDRLGAMLGLSEDAAARLAPPEGCGAHTCVWRGASGRIFARVIDAGGFESACVMDAVVIVRLSAPKGYAARCGLAALIDAASLQREGGGFIFEGPDGLRITRAISPAQKRKWTPTSQTNEDDQE